MNDQRLTLFLGRLGRCCPDIYAWWKWPVPLAPMESSRTLTLPVLLHNFTLVFNLSFNCNSLVIGTQISHVHSAVLLHELKTDCVCRQAGNAWLLALKYQASEVKCAANP